MWLFYPQEAEVKGELTDDQGEEEEVATQEPDAVLENRTTEEDVEMEEQDTKEEDSIEAKVCVSMPQLECVRWGHYWRKGFTDETIGSFRCWKVPICTVDMFLQYVLERELRNMFFAITFFSLSSAGHRRCSSCGIRGIG